MAAMEAKKSKEKDTKPGGTGAGAGRGRGAATKEASRPAPGGGGGHKCIVDYRPSFLTQIELFFVKHGDHRKKRIY